MSTDYESGSEEQYDDKPTEEELQTLRRVSGDMNWAIFTIAFAELCERFSYYGSSVLYTNFVQRPLPEGSNTGASHGTTSRIPGALGKGQKASQGIVLFNQFFAYLMPLVGAWIADAKLGRYVTIHIAIAISTVAHVILTAASAPSVITKPNSAFGAFIIGLLTLCIGTGFFKANISPMLAEQNTDTRLRVEVRKGERVIVDPAITNSRIFLYFYFAINVGSTIGQIAMVWVEKYVGFWLAFLLPTILFLAAPIVLWSQKKKYKLTPPPVPCCPSTPEQRPDWMTYDDAWVDEVRRGLVACKVFIFLPIFHLAYNQMTGNLTSQAATMELHGVPNDIIQNLNPISIVIMVPILDRLVYPGLRKIGIHLTPIKRMTIGFFFGAFSMVAACVMQYYIYKKSPCGDHANSEGCDPAPINVWAQCLPYILIGISELFTNRLRRRHWPGLHPLSDDPLLVWNYGVIAVIAFIGGIAFWFCFHHYDDQEDHLNSLKKSKYLGKNNPNAVGAEAVHNANEEQAIKA
ncbi:unnamed protein product [Parascedosporium putredinis]|uniref:Peptide transporter n=1 Tax=Parascedosporium putredinis TaxID=1442378 RepID=A0A9P1GW25_9PEZI|nr:unnamed protein product [Parascedosporium putredinis]CAI7988096.1 unnamed protein product [Parascedosporium putredinis]